ncbi:hypothetical protein V2J09_020891 [Rumex salicifolius]
MVETLPHPEILKFCDLRQPPSLLRRYLSQSVTLSRFHQCCSRPCSFRDPPLLKKLRGRRRRRQLEAPVQGRRIDDGWRRRWSIEDEGTESQGEPKSDRLTPVEPRSGIQTSQLWSSRKRSGDESRRTPTIWFHREKKRKEASSSTLVDDPAPASSLQSVGAALATDDQIEPPTDQSTADVGQRDPVATQDTAVEREPPTDDQIDNSSATLVREFEGGVAEGSTDAAARETALDYDIGDWQILKSFERLSHSIDITGRTDVEGSW